MNKELPISRIEGQGSKTAAPERIRLLHHDDICMTSVHCFLPVEIFQKIDVRQSRFENKTGKLQIAKTHLRRQSEKSICDVPETSASAILERKKVAWRTQARS